MKTLEEVLSYKNEYIISEFLRKHAHYGFSDEEASLLFDDLLRYLWMTYQVDNKRSENPDTLLPDISITQSMVVIDEMWHEFILVTEYYTDFCNNFFGRYIHHPPPMPKFAKNKETMTEEECMGVFVEELLSTTYDYLGEEVTLRWFDTYHKYISDNPEEELSHHM